MIGPLSPLAFASEWTPLEVAFWQVALGGLLFGLHALCLGRVRAARRDLLVVLAFGLIGVALFYASFQLAVQASGRAMAAILPYTDPAWVALLSWIFLKETMGPRKLAAWTLTLLGVAGVPLPGGAVRVRVAGILWGWTAGFMHALYYLFGKMCLPRHKISTLFACARPREFSFLCPPSHSHQS